MRAEDNIPELKFDNLSIERNSFADAYFIAHSTISPIYLPIVKAGICVSLAVLSASVLPLYHTFFSGIVVPVIAISFFLLLALFFMVVWPGIIKGRGAKIFDSNQMMSLPFSVAFFKSCFEIQNEKEMIEHIIVQMEEECGMDRASAIADMRFAYIEDVCKNTVVKPRESKERIRSQKIDKLLTGKYTGIPMFIAIMGLVFYLTFNVIGAALSNVLDVLITFVTNGVDNLLTAMNVNSVLHALIIDGIFNGVGSVLSFLPIIVTLFFFLSILEDSGYMARVAFIMDKLLRKLGLSGRSIVPMLIGFGCSVPGVMASRTLSSERDRRMTVLLTPFMSCSAKVPIYAFFSAAFFPHYAALVMIGMYFIGIIVGIIMAFIFKKTLFKGEPVPFVMELPNYRMPGAKNVVHLLWEKAKDFLQKAFSIIFIATILIWFMQNFDIRLNVVADSRQSILAVLAGMITPLFKPLGFGDWRLVTAILTGVMAKESVVSTISILFGSTIEMVSVISAAGAMSFLVFCLLYTPCVAAIASVKKELGGKWAAYVVVIQCVVAWIAALITYIIAGIL